MYKDEKQKSTCCQIENSLVGIEDEAVIKLHSNRGNIQDSYEIPGSDLQSLRESREPVELVVPSCCKI